MKALSAPALLERLEQRLPLLAGGSRSAPERQRTLRATIAWSHDLLTSDERRVFARLSVFAGGSTLEAAEAIAGADVDGISSLVDKSLVRRTGDRYWMLETIREFAAERLDEVGESTSLRDRHAAWYIALGEQARPELHARRGPEWLDRLEAEHANLRAAYEHLMARGDVNGALQLAGATWTFWVTRGHWTEGRRLIAPAIAHNDGVEPRRLVDGLWGAAILAIWQGDVGEGESHASRLLELSRQHGLAYGEAVGLHTLGMVAAHRGENDKARPLYEESLGMARDLDDPWLLSVALNNLGGLHMEEHDHERAIELFEESLAVGEAHGDLDRRARQLTNLGWATRTLGDAARALELLRQGLAAAAELGLVETENNALAGIAAIEADAGNGAAAARIWGWVRDRRSSLGAPLHEEDFDAAALSAALGTERLEAELTAGAALSREEVIDLALRK